MLLIFCKDSEVGQMISSGTAIQMAPIRSGRFQSMLRMQLLHFWFLGEIQRLMGDASLGLRPSS